MTAPSPTGALGADTKCPLCGHANGCDVAAGKGSCWCFAEDVDAPLVEWLAERGLDSRCLCRVCAVEGVRSPCLDVCQLDASQETCGGCHRTIAEITMWSRMSPIERARVHLRLRGHAT